MDSEVWGVGLPLSCGNLTCQLRHDLSPIPGRDKLQKMFRVRGRHDDIAWGWSKRESLGRQNNVYVERSRMGPWLPLLPCSGPEFGREPERFVGKWQIAPWRCRDERVQSSDTRCLVRAKQFALQFIVDDCGDDRSMPAEDTAGEPFRDGRNPGAPLRMRNESKGRGIKNKESAHGNSSRSPVAARFSFIAVMN